MKKILTILSLLIIILTLSASYFIDDKLKGLLKQFNTEEESAKSDIFYSVIGNSFYLPNAGVLKKLSTGDRIGVIEAVGKNVKEYLSSKEFIEKYNEMREERKPKAPEQLKSSNQAKEEQRKNLENNIKEMEKNKATLPKEMQAQMDEVIKTFKQQLKELDDPNNPMYSSEMDDFTKESNKQNLAEHKEKIADWEKEYPINNPKPLIKKWLKSFIDIANDVDFNAQTAQDENKKIRFVNSKYEYKSNIWKLLYRAGKEPTNSAKKFAQTWLSSL